MIQKSFDIYGNLLAFYTLWKLLKLSLALFRQKFRESNNFTREVTKELISRNIFSVKENFSR